VAAANGLVLNDHFQIKFQFLDDHSIPSDGYAIDQIQLGTCAPFTSGRVLGSVYDDNTSLPLAGAMVESDSGHNATTDANGFYQLYDTPGAHTITATLSGGYAPDVRVVTVVQDDTAQQDFTLPAAWLSSMPPALEVALYLGGSTTLPLTLTNKGGVTASYELLERNEGTRAETWSRAERLLIRHQLVAPWPDDRVPPDHLDEKALQPSDWYTGTTDVLLADLSGIQIMYDRAHNEKDLSVYTSIVGDLTARGATVTGSFTEINEGTLAGYDILWVDEDWLGATPWTMTEQAAVLKWVRSGHGLLIHGDEPGSADTLPALFDIVYTGRNGRAGTTTDIVYHPVTSDVSEVYLGGPLNSLSPQGTTGCLISDIGGLPHLCTNGVGTGALVVVADDDFHDSSIGTAGNQLLANQAFDWLASCGRDVPWLSTAPITGTMAPSASEVITVTFDASVPEVTQPGQYHAEVRIKHVTPYDLPTIPVTMTVTPPPTWGRLTGTVRGLGHCDANPAPLEDVTLLIEGSSGMTWKLQADIDGTYQLWLDEIHSPLTLSATHPDHELGQATGVTIVGGATTTQDFDLRWLRPCISISPTDLSAEVPLGSIVTKTLVLTNTGAAQMPFAISEGRRVSAGIPIGVVGAGSYWASTLNGDPELSSEYDSVDLGDNWNFSTLQGYEAILVNENDYGLTSGETAALRQYYDAGGSILLGMDDLDDEGPAEQADLYYIFGVTDAQDGNFYVGSLNPTHPIADAITLSSMGNDNDHFAEDDATWVVRGNDGNDYVLARDGAARTVILGERLDQWWSAGNQGLVRNALKWAAPSDVPWLHQKPSSGTVTPSTSQVVTIIFDATVPEVTGPSEYLATLTVQSDDPLTPSLHIPVTMAVFSYGVTLLPPVDAKGSDPNQTVTYTLQVANTGSRTDLYDVTAGGNAWPTDAPATLGPLSAGESTTMDVLVTVPSSTAGGATDAVVIHVTSRGDGTQSAAATLTTTANNVYGVQIVPETQDKQASPGATVSYALEVTNTGNTTDTFALIATGYTWPPAIRLDENVSSIQVQVGPLAAGESEAVDILVVIPQDTVLGSTDTASITVASQSDDTRWATATLTTIVPGYTIFLPLVSR
jgi:hypothetical protein